MAYFRHFQNRGQPRSGEAVGPTQESAEHELRQTVAFDPAILQERHYPEAASKQPFSLPVQRQVQKRLSLFDPFPALQQLGIIKSQQLHLFQFSK